MTRMRRGVLTAIAVAAVGALSWAVVSGLPATAWAALSRGTSIPSLSVSTDGLSAPWSPDSHSSHTRVTVATDSTEPVTVTIRHDGRNVLSFPNVKNGQTVDFRIFKQYAEGVWTATAETGGVEASSPIPVALHWAPMSEQGDHYPRCSDVRWYVDRSGSPVDANSWANDIAAALQELGKATGLTFTRVEDMTQANLTYSWAFTGKPWNAGVGGSRTTDDGNRHGYVQLNAESEWATRPDSTSVDGKPGRGVLILHETGHALGLGHVNDGTQIMHPTPVADGPNHLGSGDLVGLDWLYRPTDCVGMDRAAVDS